MSLPAAAEVKVEKVRDETAADQARLPPALERFGARFLQGLAARGAPPMTSFKRLQWLAAGRAAAAGVVASACIGAAEFYASRLWPSEELGDALRWWGLVVAATAVFAVAELVFIFWNALDATSRVAKLAGVEDWVTMDRPLARAALELPNPRDAYPGIDPLREASRWESLATTLLYKAKAAASNFVLKQLFKRILSRAAVRTLLPFVAIPVTASWNVIVTLKILRQARIRALGPRAVAQAVDLLFGRTPPPTAAGREAVVRAVAAAIVRTRDLHPNLTAFLREVESRCGSGPYEAVDDPQRFLVELKGLDAEEQEAALLALGLTVSLDGRVSRREVALLNAAHLVANRSLDLARWQGVALAVREGRLLE